MSYIIFNNRMKLTEKYLGRRFDSAQVHQKHT